MAKSLRTITAVAKGPTIEPKGERDFADQHPVAVSDDRNGNDDAVFKGSKVKTFDRAKHRFGVPPDNNIPTKKIDFKLEGVAPQDRPNSTRLEGEELDEANAELHDFITEGEVENSDYLIKESHYMFSHHSAEAVACSEKASSATSAATCQKDPKMKAHYQELANHYKSSSHHHLKLAASFARQAGIKEDEQLDEISSTRLNNYVKKAGPDSENKIKTGKALDVASRGTMANGAYTKKPNSAQAAQGSKLQAKGSNRTYHIAKAQGILKKRISTEETEISNEGEV